MAGMRVERMPRGSRVVMADGSEGARCQKLNGRGYRIPAITFRQSFRFFVNREIGDGSRFQCPAAALPDRLSKTPLSETPRGPRWWPAVSLQCTCQAENEKGTQLFSRYGCVA